MPEERYCSNCREELPEKADSCPACGVYAGDVFDGKIRRERKPTSPVLVALLFLAVVGAAYAIWMNRFKPEPEVVKPEAPATRVVGDRPGGARRGARTKLNEAEAIRLVRRHLVVANAIRNDCIVVMSNGFRDGAYRLTAYDRCAETRLGKWRVDGKTGEVKRG